MYTHTIYSSTFYVASLNLRDWIEENDRVTIITTQQFKHSDLVYTIITYTL